MDGAGCCSGDDDCASMVLHIMNHHCFYSCEVPLCGDLCSSVSSHTTCATVKVAFLLPVVVEVIGERERDMGCDL